MFNALGHLLELNMVSVIIPNYNHANFLKERIESVLNQTYQDFEVIILDDCSKDNSREIIEQYRGHPKVSHIEYNEANSGSTFIQWNKGFNLAKYEYIWIAESDDVANPLFLEEIMGHLIKDPSIVIGFSGIKCIDVDNNYLPVRYGAAIMRDNVDSGEYFLKNNMLLNNYIVNASAVVFKKKIALDIPKDYMSYKSAGDYLFWTEILRKGKVYYTSKKLDYFRQHNQKVTPNSIASGIAFIESFQVYKNLIKLPYVTKYHKLAMIGSWVRAINFSRKNFKDRSVYVNLINLWRKETKSLWISSLIFNLNRGRRLIQKKILKHEIAEKDIYK